MNKALNVVRNSLERAAKRGVTLPTLELGNGVAIVMDGLEPRVWRGEELASWEVIDMAAFAAAFERDWFPLIK